MLTRLETQVPPVIWTALSIALMFAIAAVVNERLIPDEIGLVAAVVLCAVGGAISLAGVARFGQAKTSVDPHTISKASSLVASGVYGYTRNPMYLGMFCVVMGVGIWQGSLLATGLSSAGYLAILTRLQIMPEERMLTEKFGDEYRIFAASVRRWI